MRASLQTLTAWQRWLLYLTFTGLPGLCVSRFFGWHGALIYELLMWIPQQRIFDALRLADTLPFANAPAPSPR